MEKKKKPRQALMKIVKMKVSTIEQQKDSIIENVEQLTSEVGYKYNFFSFFKNITASISTYFSSS